MSDVAVVGAGLVGLSCALELAKRGAAVTVFDCGEPARSASWAGAGMLAPHSEDIGDTAMHALCVASLERYPQFVADLLARTGVDAEFRRDGTLHAAFDRDELVHAQALVTSLQQRGVRAHALDHREALALEPMLGTHVVGGAFIEEEAQVDNRRLGRALRAACAAAGVTIERTTAPVEVEADERRVRGLRSTRGFHAASCILNAAGAWAGALRGVPARAVVPVVPRKGQMLALAIPRMFASHVVFAAGAYFVPRSDGRLLIGATVENAGFDERVTAGGIAHLLRGALAAAPSLATFTISETWAGLRPGSADGLPYLGATPVDGYFVATGHFRNGILLAPVTAEVVADAIEGREPALDLRPFAVDRVAANAAAS